MKLTKNKKERRAMPASNGAMPGNNKIGTAMKSGVTMISETVFGQMPEQAP